MMETFCAWAEKKKREKCEKMANDEIPCDDCISKDYFLLTGNFMKQRKFTTPLTVLKS